MQQNLKFKAAFIVAVILICIYGIIGLPKSKDEFIANWHKNIRLGLDLRGGTHLVMQVQLQDAFKAAADASIEHMKDSLRQLGIDYSSLDRNDPNRIEDADKIEIDVKGVPIAKSSAFRGMVNDQFTDWVLTAINTTDYKLTIKQSEALRLKADWRKQRWCPPAAAAPKRSCWSKCRAWTIRRTSSSCCRRKPCSSGTR
jgi:preprotein translocase subunit SecD